jgi:phosphoserine phosphatase RsbU/P
MTMDINPYTSAPWRVLLADPSLELLSQTRSSLDLEYAVYTAENGLDVLETYQQERPDLLVLAVDLPKLNGYETCKKIKNICGRRFVPVIFVSNAGDMSSVKKGFLSGGEDFLAKPYNPEELSIRVHAALRTKKLYLQLMKAYELIDRERDTLADIQRKFLSAPPEILGLQFHAQYQPSSKAGGDYYDFIQIDKDHLGVLTADVSGHGIPAAIIMAMKRILLRSFLSRQRSPSKTLESLNEILFNNLKTGHFITAFYGVIHLPTRVMTYSSAGHCPPYLINYNTGEVQELKSEKGFPLMILPNNPMDESKVQIAPNSKLVLYTDGIIEARNAAGEEFGRKRFEETLVKFGADRNADELGIEIIKTVKDYIQDIPFNDDYTLVVLGIE